MSKTEKASKEKASTTKGAPEQSIQQVSPRRSLSPLEDVDRLFESFFPRWWHPMRLEWPPSWGELAAPFEGRVPKVDVIDRENEIIIKAEIPGVDKKDLDVTMTESTVTIKGSTQQEKKEEKGDYYRSEISRGSFSRTVSLPCEVNGAKAKAKFKDGMLELSLPKAKTTTRRSIKVE